MHIDGLISRFLKFVSQYDAQSSRSELRKTALSFGKKPVGQDTYKFEGKGGGSAGTRVACLRIARLVRHDLGTSGGNGALSLEVSWVKSYLYPEMIALVRAVYLVLALRSVRDCSLCSRD